MLVSGNIKIDLDWEQSQEVVVETLKNDFISILNDYKKLQEDWLNLQPYQKEDMEDSKRYLEAIEVLLKYYMYIGDAEEFLRGAKGVYIQE
jgi:nitrogen fixation/metabolism regulation signal transduction histidine kinase